MNSNWDNAIKEQKTLNSQEENNAKRKFQTKYENWKTWEYSKDEWETHPHDCGMKPWNYERRQLYKLLGMRVIKKTRTSGNSYKTGEYQLIKSSNNTYDIKEKTSYLRGDKYYLVGVDTTKIADMKKWEDIKNRIDIFLKEAECEFNKIKIKSLIGIAPSFFNFKDRIQMTWKNELVLLALMSALIITAPFWLGYRIVDNVIYNKKNESARPLVDAYFERVKEFKNEIEENMIH